MKSAAAKVLVLGAFVAAPFVQTNGYWQHVFCLALIGVILALGLQLLAGMAGTIVAWARRFLRHRCLCFRGADTALSVRLSLSPFFLPARQPDSAACY